MRLQKKTPKWRNITEIAKQSERKKNTDHGFILTKIITIITTLKSSFVQRAMICSGSFFSNFLVEKKFYLKMYLKF